MKVFLDKVLHEALRKGNENRKFLQALKKKPPKHLDLIVSEAHQLVFNKINCLDCANCCKKLSPAITDKDITRMAKFLRTKPSDLTEKNMHLDEDGDYVFNSTPCPFLDPENYCTIYAARPKACSEYPHTDRRKFSQLLDLTLKNSLVCPAVAEILVILKNNVRIIDKRSTTRQT